jgi:hypothetical protein
MGGQRHTRAALPPGKEIRYPLYRRLDGPRARLDGCGKSRPDRNPIPRPYVPYRVAVPSTLSRPAVATVCTVGAT